MFQTLQLSMTKFKPTIISILLCISFITAYSQLNKTVDSLEKQYQSCLDKGEYMLGCSKLFYQQMDSLLNVYYKKLRSSCDSAQKENLKDEQFAWLEKRDKTFNETQKQTKAGAKKNGSSGGQDEQMFVADKNAQFVKERVIELNAANPKNYSPGNYKVSTTGFYSLDSKTEKKNGETYGYFGDIKVKELPDNRVVVKLFVCKGAPSYSSGSLTDTLIIQSNKAVYTTAEYNRSCRVIFTFFRRGIKVEEITDDYNSGCGFGHAVVADGFFKRKSNKVPTDKELTDEQ